LEVAIADDVYAAVEQKACVNNVGCAGYYRALGVTTSPEDSDFGPPSNVTGVSVSAVGVQAAANGTNAIAHVDAAGMRLKTPADASDSNRGLSFYFGYLGFTGTWDNSTQTAAVTGALAEVISVLSHISVYYDNDGTAGFNWDLTQADPTKRWNIFDNADGATNGYDTMDVHGFIDLNNLTWTPINHTKVQCNLIPALSTAPDTCEIQSLGASGFSASALAPVISIVARIASQPVMINGNQHGPDRIKFDVHVQYPWAAMSASLYSPTTAKLGLISFAAGKSGAFVGAAVVRDDNSDSLVFASGGNFAAYYAYKKTATIDGQQASVTTQVVTGQQILAFDCTNAPCAGLLGLGPTNLVAAYFKIIVGWLQLGGWKSSVAFHSLGTSAAPVDVFWDPETGASPAGANSAALAAPSLLFLFAIFLS